jgi:hypothetical protein
MTDAEFLRALESGRLADADFGHAAHVRAAYLYLRPGDFATALTRIRAAIRTHAGRLGKADRYHETITVAYLALIQQHICQRGDGGGWPGFALQNPELLQPDLLLKFYPRSQLQSELARRVFVLPCPGVPVPGACA